MKTVYFASKVRHHPLWIQKRREGVPVVSTWIDEARDKESPSLPDLWRRCVHEAAVADVTVVYADHGDHLKGALVEVGAALAVGKRVYVVHNVWNTTNNEQLVGELGSWVLHPLVLTAATVEDALEHMNKE